MWALNHERIRGSVDADNTRVELIDIVFRVACAECFQIECRGYLAGDLSIGVHLDGLLQIEIKPERIHISGIHDKGTGEIDGYDRLGEGRRHGGDGGRCSGLCIEVSESRGTESNGRRGVSPSGDGIEVEQG